MAEDRDLPGMPTKKLVRETRRWLNRYGIRPTDRRLWLETWHWASCIAHKDVAYIWGIYKKPRWPRATEIATQYVVLLLVSMQQDYTFRLHFRAGEYLPPTLATRLAAHKGPILNLPQPEGA